MHNNGVLVFGVLLLAAAPSLGQVAYQILPGDFMVDVHPIAPWEPSAKELGKRLEEIRQTLAAQNPDDDPRVFPTLVFVSARTGTRSWLKRSEWHDDTVQFAVGVVQDVQDPHVALAKARKQALKKLSIAAAQHAFFADVDWHINDEGITYVLVGGEAPSGPTNRRSTP